MSSQFMRIICATLAAQSFDSRALQVPLPSHMHEWGCEGLGHLAWVLGLSPTLTTFPNLESNFHIIHKL